MNQKRIDRRTFVCSISGLSAAIVSLVNQKSQSEINRVTNKEPPIVTIDQYLARPLSYFQTNRSIVKIFEEIFESKVHFQYMNAQAITKNNFQKGSNYWGHICQAGCNKNSLFYNPSFDTNLQFDKSYSLLKRAL